MAKRKQQYDNSFSGVMYPADGGMTAAVELDAGRKASGNWAASTGELALRIDGKPVALGRGVVLPTKPEAPRSFTLRYVAADGSTATIAMVMFAAVDSSKRAMIQIRRQKVKPAGADFDFLR